MENTFESTSPPDFINCSLTKREWEVLYLLTKGSLNKEIAETLNISLYTVKRHTVNIFSKMNVRNRAEAVTAYHSFIKIHTKNEDVKDKGLSMFQ